MSSVDSARLRPPPPPTRREWVRCLSLFALTLLSVFFSYGWWWGGGDPLADREAAWQSAQFALGLMGILGAHEAGHYVVARRHGMDQTLPFFLPFPLAFGTLGAIIRLRTPPRTRSALLEMGAAGPLAGFAVALVVLVLGLPDTTAHAMPELTLPWPPPPPEEPGWFVAVLMTVLAPLGELLGEAEPGFPLTIMANPLIMDGVGYAVLGAPPGRYDELSALGLAGWAGCFLTAMNLLPIGQLDGGHVLRAVAPRLADKVSVVGLVVVGVAGAFLWEGWTVWAILLWAMGAWRGLPAAGLSPPTPRAQVIGALALATFIACFMPSPIELETVPFDQLQFRTPEGAHVSPGEVETWWLAREEQG